MSALPKAVQDQIDKANEIVEIISKPPEGEDAENTPPVSAPDAENTPPVVPEEPAVVPEEPVAAEPATPPAEPEKDPEHKYKVLQGKYNAEVPRLQSTVKEQKDLIGELRQRQNNLESLLASMQTVSAEPPPAPAPTVPDITPEEIEQFGPDLIDLMERVAAKRILPEVDQRMGTVDTRFKEVEQSTSQHAEVVARSERDKVLQDLAAAVPNWEQQNEDEGFLGWLNERDAYTGAFRGQLLTQAYRQHDAERVIAIFKGFQTENAVVNPSEPAPTPETPAPEPQVNLEDYVAPGTPKTGTTSAPNESGKRVWSRDDVSAFYAKKNEFVVKGKPIPDEFVKLEKDLIAAPRENRLR